MGMHVARQLIMEMQRPAQCDRRRRHGANGRLYLRNRNQAHLKHERPYRHEHGCSGESTEALGEAVLHSNELGDPASDFNDLERSQGELYRKRSSTSR
jgi:hypothetical protein